MGRHLASCVEKHVAAAAGERKPKRMFRLVIDGGPQYWLHVELPAAATLEELDKFLRDIWLECCGHLSAFRIDGKSYSAMPDESGWSGMEAEDMNVAFERVVRPGTQFEYEYDFGSTTHLRLKVADDRVGLALGNETVQLLARNDPPAIPCGECGAPATQIDAEQAWDETGWLCDACAAKQEPEILLPVANSPRAGVCGYTGPDSDQWESAGGSRNESPDDIIAADPQTANIAAQAAVDSYTPPVAQLLTLGDAEIKRHGHDYRQLGLGDEHVPELIRMATDPALNLAESDPKEVWAPLHAWRALGELGATSALEPLLALLDRTAEDDDWVTEELPDVFALFGPAAIDRLAEFLADREHNVYARNCTARALVNLNEKFPETRDRVTDILRRQLEHAAAESPEFNGFIVSALLDLHAEEAAEVIERAYGGGYVDEDICGPWPSVAYELGVGDQPQTNPFRTGEARPRTELQEAYRLAKQLASPLLGGSPAANAKAKAKSRKKMAAKSRKINRRKNRK
jgi:hypothetical protein